MMLLILCTIFLVIPPLTFASINEQQFHQIPKDILRVMSSDIRKSGLELSLKTDWESAMVNAGANREENTGKLFFYGGYAKLQTMTVNSFAHTVCHELGHLIAPGIKTMPTNKYTSEAQSDYYATNICLKKYFQSFESNISFKSLGDFHKKLCKESYKEKRMLNLCAGLIQASIDQLNVENQIKPTLAWKNYNQLDKSKTKITQYNGYPSTGCRYTTSIHGALNLARPKCWFNPNGRMNTSGYITSYNYYEAMFIGTIGKVKPTNFGCEFIILDHSLFRESYFFPIDEYEITRNSIKNVGDCRMSDGEEISGTITLYEGEYFFNLDAKDK